MSILYRLAADFTVVFHMSYAMFIVVGQLLILAGAIRKWRWILNVWFRAIHLAMIAIVVAESLLGIVCPLTTLEKWLRRQPVRRVTRETFSLGGYTTCSLLSSRRQR